MRDRIINDIASQIKANLTNKKRLDYSLLGGDLGEIIFLYYYTRIYEKDTDIADYYLEKMFRGDILYQSIGSYCNGLAGLGLGLIYLEDEGFICNVNSILHNLDLRLANTYEIETTNNNIDFLHGFIGIGFYLLERIKTDEEYATKHIKKIINYLYHTCSDELKKTGQIAWILDKNDENKKFNISLSHGYSSILIFLSRLIRIDLGLRYNNMIKELILGVKKFILSQEIDFIINGSYFPTFYKRNNFNKSRLAWCYGDLGIAIALKETSITLNDNELYKHTIDILTYNAYRKGTKENNIYDGSLCHGASGLSLIFNNLYLETKEKCFYNAHKYWEDELLKMNKPIDNLMTFTTYHPQKHNNNISYGILDGISGIGLYLLGAKKILNKLLLINTNI